jgi:hypothetical protein
MLDKKPLRSGEKTYRKFTADNGRIYYVPVSVNAGDFGATEVYNNPGDGVHVDTLDPKSQGYGGSKLTFKLTDGTVEVVKGPWHTHSSSLLKETGLKITDLHYTYVIIAKDSGKGFMKPGHDIVYADPEWVLGPFMRGERLAQQLADLHDIPLFRVTESMGGASSKWHNPGDKVHPMARRVEDEN